MENLKELNLTELHQKEMQEVKGGGPVADGVHWLKCNYERLMTDYGSWLQETGSPGGAK